MASDLRAKPPGGFALSPHDPTMSGFHPPGRPRTPSKPRSEGEPCGLALGFGVWPLFADARCDGPYAAPYLRREDVEALNPEAVWNALS